MKLMLPNEEFTLRDSSNNKIVIVKDGELRFRYDVAFKDLMKKLTFRIYSNGICYSCGKWFPEHYLTMDHIFAQSLGGITITNNLIPLCPDCNSSKSNLLPEQFEQWKQLNGKLEKSCFFKRCLAQNEKFKKDKSFSMLAKYGIDVIVNFPLKKIHGYQEGMKYSNQPKDSAQKRHQKEKFYNQYGRFPKPLVLDKNYHLLGGYETLMCAKKLNLREVPVVILENVEVFY